MSNESNLSTVLQAKCALLVAQVNVNGETYPVGFMVANWAASYASHILAATLVEAIFSCKPRLSIEWS